MYSYRAGGVLLTSDRPLASLVPVPFAPPSEGSIALITAGAPFGEPDRWLYHERFDDTSEPWRAVGVLGDRRLVRLFDLADFLLDREARAARVFVAEGASPEVVEPLFLEQALPLFWSLLGRPCLHASAVAWGGAEGARAVAFAGRSGSGKSTLASSLAAAADPEGGLLADDCLVIEIAPDRVIAHPGHRSVRLLADSAEALFARRDAGERSIDGGKRRLDLRASASPLPLARIYLLDAQPAPEAAPHITRLRPRDAVAQLASCLFRIDPDDRSRLPDELTLLERIASRTVVARLSVPRRFEALRDARAAIAADLAGA